MSVFTEAVDQRMIFIRKKMFQQLIQWILISMKRFSFCRMDQEIKVCVPFPRSRAHRYSQEDEEESSTSSTTIFGVPTSKIQACWILRVRDSSPTICIWWDNNKFVSPLGMDFFWLLGIQASDLLGYWEKVKSKQMFWRSAFALSCFALKVCGLQAEYNGEVAETLGAEILNFSWLAVLKIALNCSAVTLEKSTAEVQFRWCSDRIDLYNCFCEGKYPSSLGPDHNFTFNLYFPHFRTQCRHGWWVLCRI